MEILKENQKENINYKENNVKIAYKNDSSNFASSNFAYEFFIDMLYKEDNLKNFLQEYFYALFTKTKGIIWIT